MRTAYRSLVGTGVAVGAVGATVAGGRVAGAGVGVAGATDGCGVELAAAASVGSAADRFRPPVVETNDTAATADTIRRISEAATAGVMTRGRKAARAPSASGAAARAGPGSGCP